MAINPIAGAMGNPRWPLGFSQLPETSLLFDKKKPFLASGLMSHNGEDMVKMCFL